MEEKVPRGESEFSEVPVGLKLVTDQKVLAESKNKYAYWVVKRTFDILLSLLALVVTSPLMLGIVIAIILEDPNGSPIFKQKRCGRFGKEFTFYKFRSMCIGAEKMLDSLLDKNEMTGPVFKIRDDPRITRVGRFIRKTSMDELPQFFNVLQGNMSIVGPRPPLSREVEKYSEYEWQRLWIKPGITCIWQTTPDRNKTSFEEWVGMDLQYLEEQSFWLDIKILLRTIKVVLHMNGI